MYKCTVCIGSLLLLATGATGAFAEDPKPAKTLDPNERICEKIEVIGSRIASRKVCATRAEWAERRQQERQNIDQAQRNVNVGCSTINTHSGAPGC